MKKVFKLALVLVLIFTGCSNQKNQNTFINEDDLRKFFDLSPSIRYQYTGKYTLDFETEQEYVDYVNQHLNTSKFSQTKILFEEEYLKVVGLTEVNEIFLTQQYLIGKNKALSSNISQNLSSNISHDVFMKGLDKKVFNHHGTTLYEKIIAELEESVLKESYFVIEKELTKEEYPELKQNIPMYYVLHFTYEVDKENENKIQNAKLMNDYYFQSKEKSNKIIIKETTGLSVTLDGYKINFNHSLIFEDINIPISVNFTIDTYQ